MYIILHVAYAGCDNIAGFQPYSRRGQEVLLHNDAGMSSNRSLLYWSLVTDTSTIKITCYWHTTFVTHIYVVNNYTHTVFMPMCSYISKFEVYRRVRLVIVSTSSWKAKQYTQVETTANVYDVSWTLAWHCETCVSSVPIRSDILSAPMYTSIYDILLIGYIVVCVLTNSKTIYSLKQQQMCRTFDGRWHDIANHVFLHCTYTET